MRKSYKGLYNPTHPKKYIGDSKQIVYRSLLERRFMRYCDLNEDVSFWASEELAIKYYNPITKKFHRYFPDFIIKTTNNEKFMIDRAGASFRVPQPQHLKACMEKQIAKIANCTCIHPLYVSSALINGMQWWSCGADHPIVAYARLLKPASCRGVKVISWRS